MVDQNRQRKVQIPSLVVVILLTANLAAAEKMTGFRYERVLSLHPATAQPDRLVKITLTPKLMGTPYENLNGDGSDLRFMHSDGKSPLPYWIESWDPTGNSHIWVKVEKAGTAKIMMLYGNPQAKSQSHGEDVFDFFDDFDNGIWSKPVDRPVYTPSDDRNHPDAHRQLFSILCEPSVFHEDGLFKMWYTTEEGPWGGKNKKLESGLALATSTDGIRWQHHPTHPVLTETWPDSLSRCFVMKHQDVYYLFASNSEQGDGSILRSTSQDGLHWSKPVKVLTPNLENESEYQNPGVIVDDDGIWKMLIASDQPHRISLATSEDGLHWTKWKEGAGVDIPSGNYGDSFIRKVGDTYFLWHCAARDEAPLNISVHWSKDLIHWQSGYKNPQIGHSQPWERGLGTPDVQCARMIADASIVEHAGKLWLYYCGTQSQFGLATFDGDWEDMAHRLLHDPPMSKWDTDSFFGSVVDKEFRLSEDHSSTKPVIINSVNLSDRDGYIFEFKAQKYAGPSYQIMPVVRYRDHTAFSQFWVYDHGTTWYREFRSPSVSPSWQWPMGTINVGANNICDDKWHHWKIVVKGADNTLFIDGKLIGSCKSIPELVHRDDLKVGLSTFDTFAAFDDVRVRKYSEVEVRTTVSATEVSR